MDTVKAGQNSREGDSEAVEDVKNRKKMRRSACAWLREIKVRQLVREKRRLVEVPYTATLADTVNAFVANGIVAVPVAAPPGLYIGAGGSMILESDRTTGAVRKHYIGMITMFDVLVHIADGDPSAVDLDRKMAVPVSSVIGHSLEGLSLWTLNPNTSILDCMETFSKGVHRALVPVESHTDNAITIELVESSPGYRMLTQMDILSFLRTNGNELNDIMACRVGELEAVNENVFGVTQHEKVIDVIKSMRAYSLAAVPIIVAEAGEASGDEQVLQDVRGRRLIDTFSATDLRGCSAAQLQSLLNVSVIEFKQQLWANAATLGTSNEPRRRVVACNHETTLAEVIDDTILAHVHRVWVVDKQEMLRGLVSLTDILRVIRDKAIAAGNGLQEVATTCAPEPTLR